MKKMNSLYLDRGREKKSSDFTKASIIDGILFWEQYSSGIVLYEISMKSYDILTSVAQLVVDENVGMGSETSLS